MEHLRVQISRYVDDAQPGWIACEFLDSDGRSHTLVDKVPIFTSLDLDKTSAYPQSGDVVCEVLNRWRDAGGRDLVRITTERPYGVTSTEGLTEFVVLRSQIENF